jgi:hypothetical protein
MQTRKRGYITVIIANCDLAKNAAKLKSFYINSCQTKENLKSGHGRQKVGPTPRRTGRLTVSLYINFNFSLVRSNPMWRHYLCELQEATKRECNAWWYNWPTLFLGNINTGTYPSRLKKSQELEQ